MRHMIPDRNENAEKRGRAKLAVFVLWMRGIWFLMAPHPTVCPAHGVLHRTDSGVPATAESAPACDQDGHTSRRILSAFPPMTFPMSSSE
jgi:hypothetical protein